MKATVTRKSTLSLKPVAPIDADERIRQLQHHQTAEPEPQPPGNGTDPSEPKRKPNELQVSFLNALRADRQRIAVYLLSGIRLTGILKSFDQFTLLVEHDGAQQLVFKHAVATVQVHTDGKPERHASRHPVRTPAEMKTDDTDDG